MMPIKQSGWRLQRAELTQAIDKVMGMIGQAQNMGRGERKARQCLRAWSTTWLTEAPAFRSSRRAHAHGAELISIGCTINIHEHLIRSIKVSVTGCTISATCCTMQRSGQRG